jgi:sterol desaturase/sphingolipid hydroxylase (fatty acid hydroxylase superfamily)
MMSEQVSEPYFRIGEGRISGWVSVSLGVLSVLGVLCFHFPDYLTTPQLRAAYTADQMRTLLGAGMVFSAAFGVVTFALNRHKLMGAIGICLSLLAMWGGGASVQVGPRYAAPGYVGLDWFILDLLLSAIIFVFLEKLFPHIREQAILRPAGWHDFRYFALNHLLIGVYAFAATMFAPRLFSWAVNHDIQAFVSSLPWAIQFVMAIVLADLVEYAIHRTMHEVKFLWPIHAVHHSVEHMDWMAGSRLHFLEPLVTRTLVLIPAFVLGIAKEPLTVYIIFAGFQAGLIHANIRWDLGPFKYVFCSPRYHHWHHSSDDEAIDKNYVAHLPAIDWIFGTFYMPKDSTGWPRKYGTIGIPLPRGIVRQFFYPFQQQAKTIRSGLRQEHKRAA